MKHLYFSLKILTVVFIATLLLTVQGAKAQTLAKGDIAFVRVNESTIDGFSFVALVAIPAGTQIYFTDNSWGNGVWIDAEAHFLYTAPAGGLSPGTVVHCDETSANTLTVTGGGGTMALQATTSPSFSIAGGDQIIAYQSTTGVRPASPSFIAAINTDDGGAVQTSGGVMLSNETTGWVSPTNWDLSTKGGQGSVLPTDLTNGLDAVGMFPQAGGGAWVTKEQRNMRYDCTKGTNGTKAALLILINNPSNWVFNTSTDFPTNTVCSFTVSSGAPTVTVNPPNRTICLNGSTTMGITATGSPTYKWQVNTGSGFTDITGAPYSNFTTNTLTISSATAAMSGYQYQCVVTNVNGNATSGIATLTVNSVTGTISKTDVSCNGGGNGTATVVASGGTTPYTYSWAPSGGTNATATGLTAGTYTCTITDNLGCTKQLSIAVGQPAAALGGTTAKTDVSCNGGSNGTATVSATGGTTPYFYSWAPSGGTNATATGRAAGTYTVTVTDFNGCQITRTVTINQPATLSAATGGGKTDVSCNGAANGTATVAPTGGTSPYSYSWAPSGGTNATATGLTAGTYTVTVTDNNNCQTTRTFTINQPAAALGGTISKTDVSCNGGGNGTATVAVTGGTTSYTYSWAPSGGTNATATGLSAGTYTVTVTDANACQITRTVTVNQPAAALSAATGGGKTDVSCNGGANGTATVAPTGGTTPYSYSWAPSGGTNATATGLTAGTYTATVTDNNNCQTTRTFTINQPAAALGGTISKTDVSCNGGGNGTATVAVTGGTTPYFYSWAPSGGSNATATGLSAGTYTVTVTDANSCQITRTVTINQPAAALGGTISKTDVSCNGGGNGTATVAPTGGTSPYSYSWAPSGGSNATATGLSAGTYTVTVMDANSCQITRTVTVNQPAAALGATISKTDVSCNGGGNGTATVAVTGGTTSYTYSWAPSGGTNATATGLSAGTYTVTVTDANACQITRTVTVNQPAAALSLAYGGSSSITKDAAFSYTFAATGGTPGYTYSTTGTRPNGLNLSNSGVLSGTPTATGTFIFNVIATDVNSCTRSIPVSITVADPLPVTLTGFTTKPVSGGVEVSWNTVSETNSSHFELMHATENGKFSLISRQEAMGNSGTGKRYSFLHRQPANGNNYYQLLQLDKNGDSKDYGVKTVYFTSVTKDGVSLYPNPAAHTVTVTFATKTYSQLQVTDMLGKVVRSQKIGSADTEQRISVETLPTGTYTIILTAEGKRSVHKLIKL